MPKILFAARYSVIEPLGLLHLSAIAKQEQWDPFIVLFRGTDFTDVSSAIECIKPDLVGFSLYTGNHQKVLEYIKTLTIPTILGGYHATYFPDECLKYADYVVLSEGLHGLRSILRQEAPKGIVPFTQQEPITAPDRVTLYSAYPEFNNSPIKSIITHTGCPFACSYCYNSSKINGKRLFPFSARTVKSVIGEIKNIIKFSPATKIVYFQDDVFGADLKWLKEFADKNKIKFHAQTRFEYANPKSHVCRERLNILKDCGCTGLTLAIESASPVIRKELLNRHTPQDLIFSSMSYLSKVGFKVRTEQMLGLPYGLTKEKTSVGIKADLEILKLNVKLKEETGLPTLAWASIFSPYQGTVLGKYCKDNGFYEGDNVDAPETFFQRSVLQMKKEWMGQWMNGEELLDYRNKLDALRNIFQLSARLPKGHEFAEEFISGLPTLDGLSATLRKFSYDTELYI